MTEVAELTHKDFEGLVGQAISVFGDFGEVLLTLDSIKLYSEASRRDNHLEIDGKVLPPRDAFALTLEGPLDPQLAPQTYEVLFPGMARMSLFLSPFRQEQSCMLYEIAFS